MFCIAYLPWEGYNFEDAVVISERLVIEDVYTSIHIQKYEVETKETKFGFEYITPNVPGVDEDQQKRLDEYGVAIIGSWVTEGDILVGKVSPKGLQPLSPYERLAYDIANVRKRAHAEPRGGGEPHRRASLSSGLAGKGREARRVRRSNRNYHAAANPRGGPKGPALFEFIWQKRDGFKWVTKLLVATVIKVLCPQSCHDKICPIFQTVKL